GEAILERAHALPDAVEVASQRHRETVEENVQAVGEPFLEPDNECGHLTLDAASDLGEAALHAGAQALRLVDQRLPAARQDLLQRGQPSARLLLHTSHQVLLFPMGTPGARPLLPCPFVPVMPRGPAW